MQNSVSIIIPNWNGQQLLQKHLPHVIEAAPEAQIIVVDDHSSDNSVSFLRQTFPQVVIVEKEKRDGFAGTVNAGVARSTADIVVLLNTDVAPKKDFLIPLLQHFSDASVFAVGCLDVSHEVDGIVLRGRGVAHWKKGYFIHSRGEVDRNDTAWVSGGSGAFRRSMWNTLGGMDTLYNPFYWEDIDLSYRARKAGWKTIFEPKSQVDHFHEEGNIKKTFSKKDVKRIAFRNQFIFIWKNCTDFKILFEHVFWTPIRILQEMVKGDFCMAQGWCMALLKLPKIIVKKIKQAQYYRIPDLQTV